MIQAGIAQLARASAFQAEGRGFESRFPLQFVSFRWMCHESCEGRKIQAVQGVTKLRSEAY